MNRLNLSICVLLGAVSLMSLGGCSVGSALSQPQYVDFDRFKLGESRLQVAEIIGAPRSTIPEPPDDHLVDYHEFTSGTP